MPNASRMWVELPAHDPRETKPKGEDGVIGAGCAAVMAAFYPEFEFRKNSSRYLFLVDRSASMAGQPIKGASETLLQCLHFLPHNAHFDVVGFGTVAASLFGGYVDWNYANLHAAAAWAMGLSADMGATILWDVLRAALLRHRLYVSQWDPSAGQESPPALNVVILTDGMEAVASKAVLRLLQDECPRSRARVFMLAHGDAPCRSYCEAVVRS